ncbi:NOB1 family endonuclease [Candidatus Thorarchaeota archaeon]|nr:MAG: NOB1 family endonuclease [Candidatus Thorarchaeota archaeon]
MPDLYVLDAGALFSTWSQKVTTGSFLTTPSVLSEIENRPSRMRTEFMKALQNLRDVQPSKESVSLATSAARASGDLHVLSDTDIELIALALEEREAGHDVAMVSTDLAVLNTASHLRISVIDPEKRFKKRITWKRKCPACGYVSSGAEGGIECPVCGTETKRISSRRR